MHFQANNRVNSRLYEADSVGRRFTLIVTHTDWEDNKLNNLKAGRLPGQSGQGSTYRSEHAFTMIEYDVVKKDGRRVVGNPISEMKHI